MNLNLYIKTSEKSHLTPEQVELLKSEFERILNRFTDSEFLSRTKKRIGTTDEEPLIGMVEFESLQIQHSVNS